MLPKSADVVLLLVVMACFFCTTGYEDL